MPCALGSLERAPSSSIRDREQTRITRWAAIGVAVFGAAVSVLLITFYVLPFQSATGALRDGGRLDWLTGEALLALGWAVLYVPWGVAAYKMIGRSYRADEGRRP